MKRKLLLASKADKVIQKMSFALPKPPNQLRAIYIPTAANPYGKNPVWLEEEKIPFRDMGFDLINFDIEDKSSTEVADKLKGADIVYVTGGNTYYLLEKMKKCRFGEIIRDCLDNDALYIGSSAGSIVTCPTIDFIRDMDDPSKAHLDDYAGLGLVNFKIIPHLNHPKHGAEARAIAAEIVSVEPVIGLRDDQAIFVRDDFMEVY
jgi:dipeptidase E